MSQEERQEFKIDCGTFDWVEAYVSQIYGLRRFYLKEDVLPIESKFKQLLQKNSPDYFHDIRTSVDATKDIVYKTNTVYFKDIASQHNFNSYISRMTKPHNTSKNTIDQPIYPSKVKRNQRLLPLEQPTISFNMKEAQL